MCVCVSLPPSFPLSAPPMLTPLNNLTLTVTVNDSFVLEVNISDYNLPIDSITWQRGSNVSLSSNDQFTLTNSTDTLGDGTATLTALFTTSLVDDDMYTLTVSNPAGNDSLVFDVTIQSEYLHVTMHGGILSFRSLHTNVLCLFLCCSQLLQKPL